MRSAPSPGFTLLELTTGLLVLALAASVLLPAARKQVDRMAVVGAREAAAGLLLRARSEALRRRGARVLVDGGAGTLHLAAGSDTLQSLSLTAAFGVALDLGAADRAELAWDALGIGRVASRTLRFRRGTAESRLVVSSYGRLTRR